MQHMYVFHVISTLQVFQSRVSAPHQPQRPVTGKLSMATKKSMERRKQRTVGMARRTVGRKTKTTQDSKH